MLTPMNRAGGQPAVSIVVLHIGPIAGKKGLRWEAEIPLIVAMVPKGGLDR